METHENHSKFDVGLRKFMSGGVAGCITWFAVYPMDTVKSKMQTHPGKDRLKLREVLPKVLNKNGIMRLYRGIHI